MVPPLGAGRSPTDEFFWREIMHDTVYFTLPPRIEHTLILIGIEKKPIVIISISITTAIQVIIFVLEMIFICLLF